MRVPKRTAQDLATADLLARRAEYLFPLPKAASVLLEDPRDLPALNLVSNVLLLALPSASALHALDIRSHWVGFVYFLINYALFLQRFMLTLHVTEHRRLFKREYGPLNNIISYILCPLYGVPFGMYRAHHVVMHHVEDNHRPWDLSSTEGYQRDSILQFLGYWMRFTIGTWFELPLYTARKQRYDLMCTTLLGESAYWVMLARLWQHNWVATFWTLVVPFLVSTFLLPFGNWSQHIFVDPDSPHSPYRSTYNCLSCPDNRRTYNDGYHILHHLNSRTHWSQWPDQLIKTLDVHDKEDALCFKSLGFFDIGVAVFTGNLRSLAQHIVPCGPLQERRSEDEWVQLLRRRLQPVPSKARTTGRSSTQQAFNKQKMIRPDGSKAKTT